MKVFSSSQSFRKAARVPARNALLDSWMLIAVVFVFGMISVLGWVMITQFNTEVQTSADFSNATQEKFQSTTNVYPGLMDALFLLLFFGLLGGGIASVFLLDTHPIFLFITLFGLVFMFLTGAMFSNAFDEYLQDSSFVGAAGALPFTTFILTHLLEISIGVGMLMTFLVYIKLRR